MVPLSWRNARLCRSEPEGGTRDGVRRHVNRDETSERDTSERPLVSAPVLPGEGMLATKRASRSAASKCRSSSW